MPPATAGLAQVVRRTHISHLDVIQSLNGTSNNVSIAVPLARSARDDGVPIGSGMAVAAA